MATRFVRTGEGEEVIMLIGVVCIVLFVNLFFMILVNLFEYKINELMVFKFIAYIFGSTDKNCLMFALLKVCDIVNILYVCNVLFLLCLMNLLFLIIFFFFLVMYGC